MKKLMLILCMTFLLTGCDDKVTNVINANGDSKTYQFFIHQDYSPEQYTLKLKNKKSDITIASSDKKNYYKVSDSNVKTTIIEKDSEKYTIHPETNSYTAEPIVTLENYSLGYLPIDMEKLKTQNYKTGKERIGFFKYVFETYAYEGGTTTYYFRGDKLKFIKRTTPLEENTVDFISIDSKVNDKLFKIPEKYQAITY